MTEDDVQRELKRIAEMELLGPGILTEGAEAQAFEIPEALYANVTRHFAGSDHVDCAKCEAYRRRKAEREAKKR